MYCGFCGGQMAWQSDACPEDVGIIGEGVVTFYSCGKCGAFWEGRQIEEETDEE